MTELMPLATPVVSFDLWCTLIRSNRRAFKDVRNDYFRTILSPDMAKEEFDVLVRAQDKRSDTIAEERGRDVVFSERVEMVADAVQAPHPSAEMLEQMYRHQGELFQLNPPILMDPDTPYLLQTLKDRGHQLAVVSNTGYMHGDQMRLALDQLVIGQKFDHMVFSNEVGYAKPDKRIFEHLLKLSGVAPPEVTHIGDNPRADIHGATALGMRAILLDGDTTLRRIVEQD